MTVRSIHFTITAPAGTQEVEEVYADNLPKGGGTPAAGSITNAMLAGGITKDKLASGVIPTVPAAPTAATLSGATAVGRSVMQASDAAAARTAIGAGTPYTLPAAGTGLGGVKQVSIASDANLATVIAALKTSGLAK